MISNQPTHFKPTPEFISKAKGCIFGALIGDASGAVLEFQHNITKSDVKNAIEMKGGGLLRVGPAQITDDGELTLCLLHGLSESQGILKPDRICYYYGKWIDSRPFDIGNTTRNALFKAASQKGNLSHRCTTASFSLNRNSQSNGSTMRMSPMAVWTSQLSLQDLKKAVKIDTNHTHSNVHVVETNTCFAIAIKSLLNEESFEIALEQVEQYIMEEGEIKFIKEWWTEMQEGKFQNPKRKIGWVKIAFQHAFWYLKEGWSYEKALFDILLKGGDTDTNACIIGMLLGARDGFESLDQDSIAKLMRLRPGKIGKCGGGIARPDFLVPGIVLGSGEEGGEDIGEEIICVFENFIGKIPLKLEICVQNSV